MEPSNYTDDILSREFIQLTSNDGEEFFAGARYHSIPLRFSLRDARDGIHFEHRSYSDGVTFKISSKSKLEKLRRLKVDQIVPMTTDYHLHNRWYAKRVDPALDAEIVQKTKELSAISDQINTAVGNLIKQRDVIKKELKALKKQLVSGQVKK